MRILAIVPARGGSKRLPHKNLLKFSGVPLVRLAAEQAKASGVFDAICVTSDSLRIQEAVRDLDGVEIVERPESLARDDTDMMLVVEHAFSEMERRFGFFDAIVLLQPTSPLRTPEDIVNCIAIFERRKADAVLSVKKAPIDSAFELMFADRLEPVRNGVVCNGAIYVISTQHLLSGKDWYSGNIAGYRMDNDRSIDIDTEVDFATAVAFANARETV